MAEAYSLYWSDEKCMHILVDRPVRRKPFKMWVFVK